MSADGTLSPWRTKSRQKQPLLETAVKDLHTVKLAYYVKKCRWTALFPLDGQAAVKTISTLKLVMLSRNSP